ncbi:hypothetical protein AVEN_191190-1 [Araneus ventricosus]|uniref:Uncharacterized protein n=1 Tax=Araneus ventricosus TaxID=182803 RepID=A0A4Y2EUQ7_ARAVE|nr:hypothetical protein AVEN_191190-1 [Araneus ventricosus]
MPLNPSSRFAETSYRRFFYNVIISPLDITIHPSITISLFGPQSIVVTRYYCTLVFSLGFFEESSATSPVTCSITGQRYASLLQNKIVPDKQACQCLARTAPPHVTLCVKDVLNNHFTEESAVSPHFCDLWPPRSPGLNLCDFWII